MPRAILRSVLALAAGLTLGSFGAWLFRDRPSVPVSPTSVQGSAGLVAEIVSVLHPPRLAAPEADDALATYLALPSLPAASSESETSARATLLRTLLITLPPAWFERLLTATAERAGPAEARLRGIAFTAWIELNAPAAARWIAAQSAGPGIDNKARPRLATDATLAWADLAFDPAYDWASALPDSALSTTLRRALLARLASTAPNRALTLAHTAGDEFFLAARKDLFTGWAKNDPAAAVRALGAAIHEPGTRGENWELGDALARWSRTEPAAALDWVFAQTHQTREDNQALLRRLVRQAGGSDAPASLADTIRAHPGIINSTDTLCWLVNQWVETAPKDALAWIDALPDPAERAKLIGQALGISSSRHPEGNLPLALHLPPGPQRTYEVGKILERWSNESPDHALAWLRNQNDPELTKLIAPLESRRLGDVARTDPSAALSRWAALTAGPAKTTAASAIASAWGERDPAAAARWWLENQSGLDTAQLAQPFAQHQTLTPLLAAWGRRDPDALVAWAQALPDRALRTHALGTLITDYNHLNLALDAPDARATAERLARLADRDLSGNLLFNHFYYWLRRDSASAREWAETTRFLSPQRVAEALQMAGLNAH